MNAVHGISRSLPDSAWPRVLPFVTYIAFVALVEAGRFSGLLVLSPEAQALMYPVKAGCAGLVLVFCLRYCRELRWRDLAVAKDTLFALAVGLLVFVIWIHLDQPWARIGEAAPFAPEAAPEGAARTALLAARCLGAAIIVPLAEELFWRSWLIRAVEARNFLDVPVGRPHLFSFFAVNVLFALEHHLVVAGFIAGALYTLVLYRTKSIVQCALAHAVTNGVLAVWVMATGNWGFW